MSSWKDTVPGSGMRMQITITKGHQHKENVLIPKFCASLPDLSHWVLCNASMQASTAEERSLAFSWKWCQEKLLLWEITNSDPNSNASPRPKHHIFFRNTSHSSLAPSPRYIFSKYGALFSIRKLCYNGKTILTWWSSCFPNFCLFLSS